MLRAEVDMPSGMFRKRKPVRESGLARISGGVHRVDCKAAKVFTSEAIKVASFKEFLSAFLMNTYQYVIQYSV